MNHFSNIYCSRKLATFVGANALSKNPIEKEEASSGWNAHLFHCDRKKHLIYTHNQTFYTVVVENFVKADVKNLQEIIVYRMLEQLEFDELLHPAENDWYRALVGNLHFLPTNNDKRCIGKNNDYVYIYQDARASPDLQHRGYEALNNILNQYPVKAVAPLYGAMESPLFHMKVWLDLMRAR